MDTIIAYRINDGEAVEMVLSDGETIKVFENRDIAISYAINNRLFQSGQAVYQIIELDEL